MQFIDKKLEEYCIMLSTPPSQLLDNLVRKTHLTTLKPRMISGALQGRFLSMISRMMQPKMIVEVGTFTGYASLCLAEGLTANGKLISFERNEELQSLHREFIDNSAYANNIEIRFGDAMEQLHDLEEDIDLVFIDASKKHYSQYLDILLPKLRIGGVILADNTLWSGKIIEELDKKANVMHTFNTYVNDNDTVDNLILPIRDGITMIIKNKA